MAQESQNKPSPSLLQMQKPEKLSTVLKKDTQDKQDDCLSCRLTGASAFIGLGAYSYFSGVSQLKRQEGKIIRSGSRFGLASRQAGVSTIAITLVGMGIWRLIN